MLTEKSKIITNDTEISNVMTNYFPEITKHLNLKLDVISHSQFLENIIDAFKSHESIQRITFANLHCSEVFNFCYATEEEVKKKILNLSSKKALG